MIVLDTWQYFMHRYMHHNKFLYRHIHSQHHRLVVPYAYGALYNHPLEGLLLDTIGGALSFLVSGMSPRTSIFFFSFATIKTVDDHCGLWLPGNLFHTFFQNNTAYHDVHHQLYGSKYNFSQPFFSWWDRILGTHMPYSLEPREGGGFEARPKDDWCSLLYVILVPLFASSLISFWATFWYVSVYVINSCLYEVFWRMSRQFNGIELRSSALPSPEWLLVFSGVLIHVISFVGLSTVYSFN